MRGSAAPRIVEKQLAIRKNLKEKRYESIWYLLRP